jgi:hypothetical protein
MEILRFGDRAKVTLDLVYDSPEAAERGLQCFIEAGVAMQGWVGAEVEIVRPADAARG